MALPGEVPDPAQPPSGCRFHPRCPYVFDRCAAEVPPLLCRWDRPRRRRASCATPQRNDKEARHERRTIPESEYAARRERLAERMEEQGIDALFVPPSSDLEYLTGLERDLPSFGQSSLRARLGDGRVHRSRPGAAVRAAAHVRRVPPVGATSRATSSPSTRPTTGRRSSAKALCVARATCRRIGIGARTWGESVLELQAARCRDVDARERRRRSSTSCAA